MSFSLFIRSVALFKLCVFGSGASGLISRLNNPANLFAGPFLPVHNGSDGLFRFVYLDEAFDSRCRWFHVCVFPSCILWDQSLAIVYGVSDLGLKVFCGVSWYRVVFDRTYPPFICYIYTTGMPQLKIQNKYLPQPQFKHNISKFSRWNTNTKSHH